MENWQRTLAYILVGLAVLGGVYNFYYKPKLKEVADLKGALKLMEQEIVLSGGKGILLGEEKERKVLEKKISEMKAKIRTEAEIPKLLEQFVSEVGRGLKLEYTLLQPLSLSAEDGYKRFPLRVEYRADYSTLNLYLMQLEELPLTLRVDELELRKEKEPNLEVKLILSAFVLPGGKPEEKKAEVKKSRLFYDPFFPIKTEEVKPAFKEEARLPELKGLFKSNQTSQALLDDELVKRGDSVSGFKVKSISENQVILTREGKDYILKMEGK